MSPDQGASEADSPKTEICPHLGIEEDPQTCLAYPSHWNFCHRARPAAVVRLRHQRQACLSAAHVNCPVFVAGQAAPLPAGLRGRTRPAG